jgi:hypothetical protein
MPNSCMARAAVPPQAEPAPRLAPSIPAWRIHHLRRLEGSPAQSSAALGCHCELVPPEVVWVRDRGFATRSGWRVPVPAAESSGCGRQVRPPESSGGRSLTTWGGTVVNRLDEGRRSRGVTRGRSKPWLWPAGEALESCARRHFATNQHTPGTLSAVRACSTMERSTSPRLGDLRSPATEDLRKKAEVR